MSSYQQVAFPTSREWRSSDISGPAKLAADIVHRMTGIVFVGISFLVWRILLLIIAAVSSLIIPVFGEKFPYRAEFLLKPYYENWFWVWGNFDGVHYLRIAIEGYSAEFSQAFFPFYPLLISVIGRFFRGEYLVAGFLISNLAFLAALFLLWKLLSDQFESSTIKKTIILLLIFPTSFYFGAIYTEGLFFLEIIAAFYFAKKSKWLAASFLGFFASLTRFVGVFLFPALLIEFYLQSKPITPPKARFAESPARRARLAKGDNYKSLITKAAPLLLIPSGLAIYMLYLGLEFSNPIYFLTAQPIFGGERLGGGIVLFPQVVWRYLKIFFTVDPTTLPFLSAVFELGVSLMFLVLIILSFVKTRISWAAFSFLAFITPTLTGTFSSMPRYVLICFSAYLVLAEVKNRYLISAMALIFSLLLLIFVTLFTRGYWVA